MIKSLFQILQNVTEKGFFHLLSANVFIQVAGFASQFVVAWALPPSDIGRIKILQTYTNLASIVAGLGFNTSVLKLCSESIPLAEKKFLFQQSVKYTAISTACGLAFFNASNWIIGFSEDPDVVTYLYFYSPILITLAVTNLQNAYLQSLKEIRLLSSIQVLSKSVMLVTVVIFTVASGLSGYVIAAVLGSVFTVVLAFYRIFQRYNSSLENVSDSAMMEPFKRHWNYAKYSLLSNIIYQVFLATDILLLNNLISERENIGFYSFALMLLIPFEVFRGTVVQMVTPYFSEKARQAREFNRVFQKYDRMLKGLAVGLAILALIAVPPGVHFLFAGKFDASMPFFEVLILAWILRCFYCLKSIALLGLGRVDANFYASGSVLPLSLTSSFLLIDHYQTIGAAYGSFVGELLLLLALGAVYRKIKPRK